MSKKYLQEGIQRHRDGSIERWRFVPGYGKRYRISDRGRLKRLANEKLPLKFMRGNINRKGYRIVELVGGKRFGVHQLVLLAFVGKCPDGYVSRHLDGDPDNNYRSNLKWGTHKENNQDRIRHGTIVRGSDVNTSKLTADDVLEIRRLFEKSGGRRGTKRKLAKRFKITETAIGYIINRKNWKHI